MLCVRRGTARAERPNPLRVCRCLNDNALNGIVPSSLFALTNLDDLCVPPQANCACESGRCASDRSALLRAHGMLGASSGAVRQQGLLRYSQRRPRARDVTWSTQGAPHSMGTVRGYRRGTWLLWILLGTARAAESASGVQRPQLQRADGECAELALRAHQAFLPVRAPSCQRRLRVRPRRVGSIGSAPSARHVGGMHCMSWASSGAVRQQGCCGTLRGGLGHAM